MYVLVGFDGRLTLPAPDEVESVTRLVLVTVEVSTTVEVELEPIALDPGALEPPVTASPVDAEVVP